MFLYVNEISKRKISLVYSDSYRHEKTFLYINQRCWVPFIWFKSLKFRNSQFKQRKDSRHGTAILALIQAFHRKGISSQFKHKPKEDKKAIYIQIWIWECCTVRKIISRIAYSNKSKQFLQYCLDGKQWKKRHAKTIDFPNKKKEQRKKKWKDTIKRRCYESSHPNERPLFNRERLRLGKGGYHWFKGPMVESNWRINPRAIWTERNRRTNQKKVTALNKSTKRKEGKDKHGEKQNKFFLPS